MTDIYNLRVGDVINNYRLTYRIDSGQIHSELWLVEYTKGNIPQRYVFKIFKQKMGSSQGDSFEKQFEIAKNLNNNHILSPLTLTYPDDFPVIMMKYYDKGDISAKKGKLSKREIEKLFMQMSEAICYLHDKGINHRDIKPSNILIDDDENYLLTDFGISFQLKQTITMTKRSGLPEDKAETPEYAPPVPVNAGGTSPFHLYAAGDIFSFGITMFEMITGELPNAGYEMKYVYTKDMLEDGQTAPPLYDELRPYLDFFDDIMLLIGDCLQADFRLRPSAQSLKDRVKKIFDDGDVDYEQVRKEIVRYLASMPDVDHLDKIDYEDKNELFRNIKSKLGRVEYTRYEIILEEEIAVNNNRKDDDYFSKAKRTKEGLIEYLRLFPNGRNISDAKILLIEIEAKEENDYLESIIQAEDIQKLINYINNPNSRYRDKAQSAYDSIAYKVEFNRQWNYLNRVISDKDIDKLEKYIKDPNTKFQSEARTALEQILKEKKDEEEGDWNNALILKTREGFKEFILKHPKSKHVNDAMSFIEDIDWDTAHKRKLNKRLFLEDLKKYIGGSPLKKYSREARKLIEQIEFYLQKAENAWREAQEKNDIPHYKNFYYQYKDDIAISNECIQCFGLLDEKEWEKACDDNTIESYEYYRKSYPKHGEDAKEKIDKLKVEIDEASIQIWEGTPEKDRTFRFLKNFIIDYPQSKYVEEARVVLHRLTRKRNTLLIKNLTLIILAFVIIVTTWEIIKPTEKKAWNKSTADGTPQPQGYLDFLKHYNHEDSCVYCNDIRIRLKMNIEASLQKEISKYDSVCIHINLPQKIDDQYEIDSMKNIIYKCNEAAIMLSNINNCYCRKYPSNIKIVDIKKLQSEKVKLTDELDTILKKINFWVPSYIPYDEYKTILEHKNIVNDIINKLNSITFQTTSEPFDPDCMKNH